MSGNQPKESRGGSSGLLLFLAIMVAVLAVLFHRSFVSNQMLFANDSPLGAIKAENCHYPDVFTGRWIDLNWVGFESPSAAPNISGFFATVASPEGFVKAFAPFSLLLLGFSAWLLFRQLKFSPLTCVLGGIAAGLNMHFFSVACWGLGTWTLAGACMFLAVAAMVTNSVYGWAKAALAGLAVGMAVMEGFDVGAILSVFAGVFAVFVVWIGEGSTAKKSLKSIWFPGLVVVFAGLMAAHTVASLIGTQIRGIAGTGQDEQSKAGRWNFATQWSVPKWETLRLFVPGVFGYRLDVYIHGEDRSSSYWGRIGEDTNIPLIDSDNAEVRRSVAKAFGLPPQYEEMLAGNDPVQRQQIANALKARLQRRHSGSGEYAGILVAVLAVFGFCNAARRTNAPYSTPERRIVWFWGVVAVIALLMAFGRHAFLYKYFYQLPYTSTVRGPMKFLFAFHVAWIILAGFGLEVLSRRYLNTASVRNGSLMEHVKRWWGKVTGFDKKWVLGCIAALIVVVLGTMIAFSSRTDLERYLANAGFAPDLAPKIASFCYGELFWAIIYLAASIAVVTCIMSGAWNGRKSRWAWIFLGGIMTCDLARSDWRWIEYYDFSQRYMSNPVIDLLRDKPYEHRVTAEITPMTRRHMSKDPNMYHAYFDILQNQLQYLNIQALDVPQMPRTPEMEQAYINAFQVRTPGDPSPSLRLWQLTNTRYVLGSPGNEYGLRFDASQGFQPRLMFGVTLKPGLTQAFAPEDLTYVETKDGPCGVYEYTNALPRVKLYSNWLAASTNDQETLSLLASPSFDPQQKVIVAADTPAPSAPSEPNADPGTATITSYKPKDVKIQANAKTASVLLLNDRTAPEWKVLVDGKSSVPLRCNYLMRGVYLPKGEHTVEFLYEPPVGTLFVSLGAWVAGILIAGFLCVTGRRPKESPSSKEAGKPLDSKAA